MIVAGEQETVAILREAIEHGVYRHFTFGDASKSPDVARKVGAGHLYGMYGTAGAAAPESTSAAVWRASYEAAYGGPPVFAYVKETYDATIALALAAQAAGSTAGEAIVTAVSASAAHGWETTPDRRSRRRASNFSPGAAR